MNIVYTLSIVIPCVLWLYLLTFFDEGYPILYKTWTIIFGLLAIILLIIYKLSTRVDITLFQKFAAGIFIILVLNIMYNFVRDGFGLITKTEHMSLIGDEVTFDATGFGKFLQLKTIRIDDATSGTTYGAGYLDPNTRDIDKLFDIQNYDDTSKVKNVLRGFLDSTGKLYVSKHTPLEYEVTYLKYSKIILSAKLIEN